MDIFPAIILIAVAAVAGYFIGIYDGRMTAALLKKAEDAKAATENASEAGIRDSNLPGEHTVLKVTIDNALKWHLELDKTRLDNPEAISPEQRQRMVNVVVQMRPWLDGKPVSAAPIMNMQPSTPEPPSFNTLKTTTTPPPSATAPKIDPMRGFRSLLHNEIKKPEEQKNTSIVAMIDEVLQAKLLNTSLTAKDIRLEDGPLGEVIVWVGAQRYAGVNAVPEPEIRDMIKSAISDWEKK